MAIGIPWEGTTGGMKATGHVRHMRALDGWVLTMMGNDSLRVTGRETAGEWSTIIAGIGIATATAADSTMTTIDRSH